MKKILYSIIATLFLLNLNAQFLYVGTYAGSTSAGFVNGNLTTSRFNYPYGVAFDGANTLYVADLNNNAIRAINLTTGMVSTIAGTGSAGFVNGIGTNASFNMPAGVYYKHGYLYVADDINSSIRRINLSNDSVETVAGTGSSGFQDGPALSAKFYEPKGLIVDDSDNVYVADYGNNRIRKISGGIVTTFAGSGAAGYLDGPNSSAQFHWPRDLTFDPLGNIYVTDILNNYIRRISNGTVSTLAGSGVAGGQDGTGSGASFYSPVGIIYVNGDLYVVDGAGNKIRKVTMSGVVTTIAGSATSGYINGACSSARFDLPQGIAADNAGNLYIGDRNNNTIRIIGTTSNSIDGNVIKDLNSNCMYDVSDSYLTNRIIKAVPGPYYASTDANGHYSLPLPSGTYTVSQIINNPLIWDTVCPLAYTHTVSLTNGTMVNNKDFALHPKINCAVLSVDVAAAALRHCRSNSYYVSYCNNGTDSSNNTYIDITLDSAMVINSSNLSYTNSGNVYRFNLGTVQTEECGNFWFTAFLACNAPVASTHCVKANIGPASSCAHAVDSTWDKSSVSVTGVCNDTLACFTIKNNSSSPNGDMTASSQFRVYENGALAYTGSFQLAGGADTVICWPGNGNTIQLQADQRPGHPGHSHPNAYVEDCGTPGTSQPVFGIVTATTQDDEDADVEIECLQVIASLDPNDKTVIPAGLEADHYIKDNDELEYRIRFQNTGNDTAFDIVIRDTISPFLDPTTIVSGSSSNKYTFKLIGDGVAQWTFKNILLPDSNINEPGSHAFVKFKIKQTPGNTPGTRIENRVGIIFDFNVPVMTNTAFSTIWQELILTVKPNSYSQQVKAYPNPSTGLINFEFETLKSGNWNLVITDLMGRVIQKQSIKDKLKTSADLSVCPKGIYFYRIESEKEVVNSGKIIIQ